MIKTLKSSLYLLILSSTLFGCANGLFYHPDKENYRNPNEEGYEFHEIWIESSNGTKLHGWHVLSMEPSKGIVLHFHGNAQNLSAHYGFVNWLPNYGYELIVFDYRGYGKSAGKPSRAGIFDDSSAALRYADQIAEKRNIPLFIIGQSLGGANAITATANNPTNNLKGIVVDSAFASHRSVAKSAFGKGIVANLLSLSLPVLVSKGYEPIDFVQKIKTPIAFVHGTKDTVVPYQNAELLYEKANFPKYLWRIEGGSHTNALSTNKAIMIPRILKFFEDCRVNAHPEYALPE